METIIFVVGVVVGYFIEKALDAAIDRIRPFWKHRHWKKAEQVWKKYESLSFGLEVVQTGWKGGIFSEDQVIVTIDDVYKMPSNISVDIYNQHKAEWEAARLENNLQYGIAQIDPHRISDDLTVGTASHELRIKGHTFHYFDFLSTNRLYRAGSQPEQELLTETAGKPHYLEPVHGFPNPLSVGLSLFCENGNCLVLTRRTKLASSGGLWSGYAIFNAVGEGVTPSDTYGVNYQGNSRLSPWITAKRGLHEEMGIEFQNEKMSLVLHSFVWDTRILDYKFFGYVMNSLSRAEVRKAWNYASDRHESWEIMFYDCGNKDLVIKIVKELAKNREEWASECILCTTLSLLHPGKLTSNDLENAVLGA